MVTVQKLPEEPLENESVLAVGTFDGLHRGHQGLLESALEEGDRLNLPVGVLTFEPDPVQVLGDAVPTDRRLLTRDDKIAILDKLGFDSVYEIEFDRQFAEIPARQFVEGILLDRLRACSVHVGFNFRFGHKRQGDTELLKDVLNEGGAKLFVKEPISLNGETISSTKIREFLKNGEVARARRFLGRPYVTFESVQQGQGRGQSIGFPTFNFPLRRTIHPRRGVYAVWLETDEIHRAVANFGRHPTVGESSEPLLEVHVLESPPDLEPGDRAHVHFGSFLRDEQEFESVDQLKEQIDRDVDRARAEHETLEEPVLIGTETLITRDTMKTEV